LLFAVHKLISYNLVLAVIYTCFLGGRDDGLAGDDSISSATTTSP
jgi:hypothetical protein